MILGTAAYMAPEQARGKPVDKRADIWAFGAVLYEMLTGRRAFDGEDVSSIPAAVIQSEPRWDGVPPSVRELLGSCLQKDPKKRLRDIGDVWALLDDDTPAHSRSRAATAGWVAAGLFAVVAGIAFWGPWRTAPSVTAQPLLRLDVDLGEDVSLAPLFAPTFSSLVISPDGTRLAYLGSLSGASPKLFTRRLHQPNATELAGTEGAVNPFFSPDGQWVAFWNGKQLAKVAVDGGAVVPLADVPMMAGAVWGEDGDVVIGSGSPFSTGLLRIPATGGSATPVLDLAIGESFLMAPRLLPGGKSLLINAVGSPPTQTNSSIDVVTIADRKRKTIVRGVGFPRYLPSGHLIYTNKSTILAVPFDLERLETRGTAVPVLDDVAVDPVANGPQFDVSSTGTLVYRRSAGSESPIATVQWLDPAGKQEPLLAKPAAYLGTPRVSPDSRRVAMTIKDGIGQEIWVYDLERDAMTRISTEAGLFSNPVWSSDGRYLVFGSFRGMLWARADGSGQAQALTESKSIQFPSAVTADGTRLAYTQIDGLPQLWTVPLEEQGGGLKVGAPERLLTTNATDIDASFSPDGRWIAYTSNESGRFEVYVRASSASSPLGERKWLISNSGGGSAVWSRTRSELMYRSADRIMAVGYAVKGDSFVAEKPRAWIENARAVAGFDPAPDNKRVAVFVPVARVAPRQERTIVVVLNFFDELRRRVPVVR
jgi:Tol biopolymer transport system component